MRRWIYWLPAFAWAGYIFYLSTKSFGSKPRWWFENADKLIHAGIFGVLSLCLLLAFRKANGIVFWKAALLAFFLTVAYGSSDELHQFFTPTRTPDFADLLADMLGASVVFLGFLVPRSKPR